MVAVPVGGDTGHFERIKAILRNHHIPAVGEYLDAWMSDEKVISQVPGKVNTNAHKRLVAIPNPREVIIYSRPFPK